MSYQQKMKLRHWQNISDVIVNPNFIVQSIIEIKNGLMTNVNMSAKSIVLAKKIIAGILVHVFMSIVST